MKKRGTMSEIINKPQPPVVRSGCKAPPPFRRIPAGAGKPGTKKGDSGVNCTPKVGHNFWGVL